MFFKSTSFEYLSSNSYFKSLSDLRPSFENVICLGEQVYDKCKLTSCCFLDSDVIKSSAPIVVMSIPFSSIIMKF